MLSLGTLRTGSLPFPQLRVLPEVLPSGCVHTGHSPEPGKVPDTEHKRSTQEAEAGGCSLLGAAEAAVTFSLLLTLAPPRCRDE